MSEYPILFNLTIDQLRRIGARGGRAHARNWRARRNATPVVSPCVPAAMVPLETIVQAVAISLR